MKRSDSSSSPAEVSAGLPGVHSTVLIVSGAVKPGVGCADEATEGMADRDGLSLPLTTPPPTTYVASRVSPSVAAAVNRCDLASADAVAISTVSGRSGSPLVSYKGLMWSLRDQHRLSCQTSQS
jgi:hypothetical protein